MSEHEFDVTKRINYLYISHVGGLSLLGTIYTHDKKIIFSYPVVFVVGNMAGGWWEDNDCVGRLRKEMAIVREHFPNIGKMKCQLTWLNAPCEFVEE